MRDPNPVSARGLNHYASLVVEASLRKPPESLPEAGRQAFSVRLDSEAVDRGQRGAEKTGSDQNGARRQTLQATALVHDAYTRLVDRSEAQDWNSRGRSSQQLRRPCAEF